jgi:AmmeMemoRadiSam system protein B
MENIRASIGGAWYPHDPGLLVQNLDKFFANAEVDEPPGKVMGLIVPHAGHMYSGQVAAYAYKCIKGMEFDTVIIVSPSHYLRTGNIITSSQDAYETPLGTVKIDKNLMNRLNHALMDNCQERLVPVRNDPEHAIEVELPFLQQILGNFRFLPVMMFSQDSRTAQALGHSLARVVAERNILLIASSDLSHFYPESQARKFDVEMLRRIESFDPESVIEAEIEGSAFACGSGAIASVLWACRDLGADLVEILNYANSGDVTGDSESVVGYGAAVIVKTN